MRTNSRYRAIAAAIGAAIALSLAGCATAPETAPTRIPVPNLTATGGLQIDCGQLKNAIGGWTIDPALSPGPGTPAEAAAKSGGTGCVFADGDDHLLIGIAKLDDDSVTNLIGYFTLNGLGSTDKLKGKAYFDPITGDAEVFDDGTWISIVSSSFESPSDAASILAEVESAIAAKG